MDRLYTVDTVSDLSIQEDETGKVWLCEKGKPYREYPSREGAETHIEELRRMDRACEQVMYPWRCCNGRQR